MRRLVLWLVAVAVTGGLGCSGGTKAVGSSGRAPAPVMVVAAPPASPQAVEPVGQTAEAPPVADEPGAAAAPPVQVSAPPNPGEAPPTPQAPRGPVTYTWQAGDTLPAVARRFYGDGTLWPRLVQANRDRLQNLTDIPAGTVFVIPPK